MTLEGLRKYAEQAIERAMDKGAAACDIIASEGSSFSVSAQNGEIDKFKVTSSNVIGLRVIKDQRVGISYSESLDEPAIAHMVDQALELSRFSGVDEYQTIDYRAQEDFNEDNPQLYQEDHTTLEEKLELALQLEAQAKAGDPKVKSSPYNGYGDGEASSVYMNHLGTFCSHREKSFSCYTSVLVDDNGRQAMFGESDTGRLFAELSLDRCVATALRHGVPLASGKAVVTGKYDLIFSTDQLEQLFNAFASIFSGKAAKEGKSPWREKLGETVASKLITVADRPQYPDGFYYSSFDDEGIARRDLTLIANGVLQNLYHNTATAAYFKSQTSAHAARSAKGALGVAGTHVVIGPGQSSEEDITGGDYIEVIGLKGIHSGTNPISGHFSLAIDGIKYKNGRLDHYVRDVTISGSFFQLIQGVSAVARNLEQSSSKTFFSPKIRFENISVAG